jgi:cytochrome P450
MSMRSEAVRPVTSFPFGDGRQLEIEPEYEQARLLPGLMRVSLPYGADAWLVTRMADAKQVLTDRRLSRAAAYGDNVPRVSENAPAKLGLLSMDGPAHRELSAKISPAFSAQAVAGLRPWIEETAARLWHDMCVADTSGDFVTGYARPLPALVMAKIFGVPEADWDKFRHYGDALLPAGPLPAEETAQLRRELYMYLMRLMDPASEAEDGLLRRLASIQPEDETAAREYNPTNMAIAILIGGFETTAQLLANFVYLLATHGELADGITTAPETVPRLVDELIRVVPLGAVGVGPRVAMEDLEIAGQPVRRGEVVIVSGFAANQDPAACPRAATIDPDRSAVAHIAFGHGPHSCIAARLARAEFEVSLHTLFVLGPRPRLATDAFQWRQDNLFRGLSTLRLTW